MKRIILTAVAAAAVLTGSVAAAAPAFASNGPAVVKAVVHSAQHPDTTTVAGPATIDSPGGPVWAYDNLSMQLAASDNGKGTWTVNVTDNGSFAGFADPATGGALPSNGPLKGTYQLTVTSPSAPVNANLPSQMDGTGTAAIIAKWFGVDPSAITGGPYDFSYQNGNYEQSYDGTNSAITGSIRGH